MDGLFAGTPPLEALRFLVHEAATVRAHEPIGSKVIMVNDVARAFFEAPAVRNVCVEIPVEDREDADLRRVRQVLNHGVLGSWGGTICALSLYTFQFEGCATCAWHAASSGLELVVLLNLKL